MTKKHVGASADVSNDLEQTAPEPVLNHSMPNKKPSMLLIYPGDLYAGGWGRRLRLKPHMVYIYTLLKEMFDLRVWDVENTLPQPENGEALQAYNQALTRRIRSIEVDYVAISCWSSLNYLTTRFIAEQIKSYRPQTVIIVGGYHPTFVPQDFTGDDAPFDHVIAGEINNIFSVIDTVCPNTEPTHTIDPDYAAYPYFKGQKTVGIFLGTGCPFHCRYCMEYKRQWQALPVEKAVDLIERLKQGLSIQYVTIFDACFGLDRAWRRELFKALIRRKLDCYFWFETRIDLIDEVDIELMAQLKVKVDFGVDSFSKTMLGIMRKSPEPKAWLEKFINISDCCSRHQVLHDIFLIFNHPGENRQTYQEFKAFFLNRVAPFLADGYLRVKYQRYAFFPGSYVFNHRRHYEQTYGFQALHPEWWKEAQNHYQRSRAVIPSVDSNGEPYFVPLKETAAMVKAFNRRAMEPELWQRLHAFRI